MMMTRVLRSADAGVVGAAVVAAAVLLLLVMLVPLRLLPLLFGASRRSGLWGSRKCRNWKRVTVFLGPALVEGKARARVSDLSQWPCCSEGRGQAVKRLNPGFLVF